MNYQHILTATRDNLLYITINRAHKLNALNRETIAELSDVFAMATRNNELRGVLLTGAGEKAFVAGADISEFADYTIEQGEALARNGQETLFNVIENCNKPVVAAINGFALGGGLELAMACHIRIAADTARMGLPEVTLGLIPGYGGTQRLTQLVGKGRAIEMITTADMITAEKAERIGLVNGVVPAAELLAKAEEMLNKIKLRAPLAISAALKAIHAASSGHQEGYMIEIEEFGKCFGTADFKEGSGAFLEKRKADFKGL